MLEVKNLNFRYFGSPICLHDIDLSVSSGELVVIYGNTKSGKTTLLKVIAGIEHYYLEGNITIDGIEVNKNKAKVKNIGLVLNSDYLLKRKSVLYNLMYPLKVRNMKRAERKVIAIRIAEEYGITSLLDKSCNLLSPYDEARVNVARMFVCPRDYYLVDNPFSKLCERDRIYLLDKMLAGIKKCGAGCIYATDSINELVKLNAKSFILDCGYVVDSGCIKDIMSRPSSLSSAKVFEGITLNIIAGFDAIQNTANEKIVSVFPIEAVSENAQGYAAIISDLRGTGTGILAVCNIQNDFISYYTDTRNHAVGDKVLLNIDKIKVSLYDADSEKLLQ